MRSIGQGIASCGQLRCWRVISVVAGLMLGGIAMAQIRPLNDTGQIECYNNTASTGTVSAATPDPEAAGFNEQDCTRGRAAADAVGVLRKVGASSAPGRDYTKIANDGSELPASAVLGSGAGDWGCTRDNVTGLIWEIKTDDNGLRDKDHIYTWYDTNGAINGGDPGVQGTDTCNSTLQSGLCNTTAFRDAVNALTSSNRLCAANDWRLPTDTELQSLVIYGANPDTDSTYVPDTDYAFYVSGVTYAPIVGRSWVVGNGILLDGFKSAEYRVRLVRGGQ